MSYFTFLTSDCPMAELKNPHVKLFSVNEALENGITLSDLVIDSQTIDKDKPGVILWCDSEENMGEIEIRCVDEGFFCDGYGEAHDSALPYYSALELCYTKERGKKLIEYIRRHLEAANELEIWETWVGLDFDEPRKIRKQSLHIGELTEDVLEGLFVKRQYDCIIVKKNRI